MPLPRAKDPGAIHAIRGDVWNAAMATIEKGMIQSVAGDLEMSQSPSGTVLSSRRTRQLVLVKVTGNASGAGKYTGRVWQKPAATPTDTGNLAESEIGADPGSDNALIFNAAEVGQTTHDLTAGTPRVKLFIGFIIGVTADSKPVVVINGIDTENDCPTI